MNRIHATIMAVCVLLFSFGLTSMWVAAFARMHNGLIPTWAFIYDDYPISGVKNVGTLATIVGLAGFFVFLIANVIYRNTKKPGGI